MNETTKNNKKVEDFPRSLLMFIIQITIIHFITYFFMGLIFSTVLDYHRLYNEPPLSFYMRPTDSPWVYLGSLLQLVRGVIMGIALYPFRRVILDEKYGWLYLFGLFYGLAILNTFGPTPGSIEGMIYTQLPLELHLMSLFTEVLFQTLLLSILFYVWANNPRDKRIFIPILITFIITLIFSIFSAFLAFTMF